MLLGNAGRLQSGHTFFRRISSSRLPSEIVYLENFLDTNDQPEKRREILEYPRKPSETTSEIPSEIDAEHPPKYRS